MHIGHIRTSIKGMLETELQPLTLVVGEPGSHKSGLIAALSLALTGTADGIGAQPARVMALAPKDTDASVELRLHDGELRRQLSYRVSGTTAKAAKPVWTLDGEAVTAKEPVGIVLGREALALLGKAPNRQREAILRVAAPKDLLSAARKDVPEAFQKTWDKLLTDARTEAEKGLKEDTEGGDEVAYASDADVLVTVAELIRERLREARKIVKEGTGAAGPAPEIKSNEQYEGLKFKQADLENRIAGARKLIGARTRLATIDEEIAGAATVLASEGLPSITELAERKAVLAAVKVVQDFYRTKSFVGSCLVTGAEVDFVEKTPAELSAEIESASLVAGIIDLQKRTRDDLKTAYKIRKDREQKLAEKEALARAASAKKTGRPVKMLEEERAELLLIVEEQAKVQGDVDASEFDAQLEAAREAIRQEDTARAARKQWEEAQTKATDATKNIDVMGALGKTADRLVTQALAGGITDFTRRANHVLESTNYLFGLKLFDGRKAVCRVGLSKNDLFVPFHALSGQERYGFALPAFASAWAESRTELVKLLVIDDVWLNAEGLRNILTGLGEVTADGKPISQAIVCAVTDYGVDFSDLAHVVRV